MSTREESLATVDRAIAAASDRWSTSALLDSDYDASNRFGSGPRWWRLPTGPNDVTESEHQDLRAQSRHLVRNDAIAAGAINVNVSQVVGTGLTMRPALSYRFLGITEERAREWSQTVAERFRFWATSQFADATGQNDFYGLQSLALRTTLQSGDCGFLPTSVSRPRWPFKLAVQLIEADRISNKENRMDTDTMVSGCRISASGETTGFWVADRPPTKPYAKWTFVEARGPRTGRLRMGLLFDQTRPGEVRGKPYLTPVMAKLKELGRYSEAELTAAVTSAALTVFTRMDQDAFRTLFSEDQRKTMIDNAFDWDGVVKTNTAINLLPGEEVDIPENKRPNANFDPFFLSMVRQIGIGLEIPYEVLIKHFTASYSAARAAMLDAWKTFFRRRDWLAKRFCQPIYFEWLANDIAAGNTEAPGFFDDTLRAMAWSEAAWIGDGPGSLDPESEVNASEKRMALGLSTLEEESVAYNGRDWETKHAQRVREVQRRRADGLEQDPVAMAQMAAQAQRPAPDNLAKSRRVKPRDDGA